MTSGLLARPFLPPVQPPLPPPLLSQGSRNPNLCVISSERFSQRRRQIKLTFPEEEEDEDEEEEEEKAKYIQRYFDIPPKANWSCRTATGTRTSPGELLSFAFHRHQQKTL